jgi:hypothetical protein
MSGIVFSQEPEEKVRKHEVKGNAFNILIFKSLDLSYEYLINDESSVGATFLVNLNDIYSEGPVYYEQFAFTTYYRRFFSRKYAWGFFMEAFGMYNTQEDEIYDYITETDTFESNVNKTNNYALGISLGAKFVSRRAFVFEFFGGVGRNLFTSDSRYNIEFVPRLGINLGYRF